MSDNNDETLTSEEEEKLRGLLESRRRLGLHMNVLIFQAHFERNRSTAVKRACDERQQDENDGKDASHEGTGNSVNVKLVPPFMPVVDTVGAAILTRLDEIHTKVDKLETRLDEFFDRFD